MNGEGLPLRNSDLIYRLRGLAMAGSVLYLGAHPDDEESGLIAYLSRGMGVRTVYWSATRGEGGQNRIGAERGEALGILRTWESLDARELDGGEVRYGPFYDFGFSRTGEDALARWQRTAVVREIVRAIRSVQPEVVVSRWRGTVEDGHGQHQAVGLVVDEAFDAAADPAAFPELLAQQLPPWRPQKLFRSAVGDWQPGEDVTFGQELPELERPDVLRINLGEFDPISGRSYHELASIGVNRHRSQAMAVSPARGDHISYFRLDRSLVPIPQPVHGFFDGLDPTLVGLAGRVGERRDAILGHLEEAMARARHAVESFRPDRPSDAGMAVLDGLAALRRARDELGPDRLGDYAAVDRSLARKITDFEETAARCLGIDVDCLIEESRLTPGETTLVSTVVWNAGESIVDGVEIELDAPPGWIVQRLDPEPGDPARPAPTATSFRVGVPEEAALSSPYWLREPREPYRYRWPDEGPLGLAMDPPQLAASCHLRSGWHRITIVRPAMRRETFVGGSRELPPEVLPPIALRPRERRHLVPASDREVRLELQLAARSMRDDVAGTLRVDVPEGWTVNPVEAAVSLARRGQVHTIPVEVVIPAGAKPGVYQAGYRVESGGRDYGVVLDPVRRRAPGLAGAVDETNCITETFVSTPAAATIHLIDAEFVGRLNHAYIRGADEDILPSLQHFNVEVTMLTPEELSYADLGLFDAVVVGPNAYLISDDVRRNAGRLLDYVERGGTLIVQYQGYGYEAEGLAPYPFRYRQPHDRITAPDAPVRVLDPAHPVLSTPNRIVPEDFDGWVHDRGLYFFGEWDKRYQPLLESADPGQEPQRGGLLVASHGRGTYVYAGYSFFRQIPDGVPGAVRLFANLLGLPRARILDRVRLARRVAILSFLDDDQLYDVVRLMSERWLDPGTVLCREGDRGSELYMVLEGKIDVLKGDREGTVVHTAGQGEVVGELAVLTDLPRSATLRARGDVKILVMRGPHFRGFLRDHPDLSYRMTALLAQRLASSEVMW
jgi:LmbE family N-acetylglucosaminyl deacetylase